MTGDGPSVQPCPASDDKLVTSTRLGRGPMHRRQRHIGDFTKWKQQDDYQKAFDRLLRDVQAESAPPKA